MTARTPGTASALPASIRVIRACACGLRNTRATSMPGSSMSPVYLARPVTRSTASILGPRLPMTFIGPPVPVVVCCAIYRYVLPKLLPAAPLSRPDIRARRLVVTRPHQPERPRETLHPRRPRCGHHRVENLLVRRAPAQIAAQREPRLFFGGVWHPIEQRLRRHDLP